MKSWIKLVMAIGILVGIGMPAIGSINVPLMDYYYSWTPNDIPNDNGGTWNLNPYDPILNPNGYKDYLPPQGNPTIYEEFAATYMWVPNIINPVMTKHVYLELITTVNPINSVFLADPLLHTIQEAFDSPVAIYDPLTQLWETTWHWSFPQIYDHEIVYLDCIVTHSYVVSLEIGNKCIPEPATIVIWSLLSLTCGGFGLRVWRRNSLSLEMMGETRTPWSNDARTAIHQLIERGRIR
jgi:hypothetical protein